MKNREFVKAAGAVLIIITLVVGAFLYNNSRSQSQVRNQESTQKTQDTGDHIDTGINSPSNDKLAPSRSPEAGPSLLYVIPATGIVLLYRKYRSSRQALENIQLN